MLYTHFVIYLESKRKRHEAEERVLSLSPQRQHFWSPLQDEGEEFEGPVCPTTLRFTTCLN